MTSSSSNSYSDYDSSEYSSSSNSESNYSNAYSNEYSEPNQSKFSQSDEDIIDEQAKGYIKDLNLYMTNNKKKEFKSTLNKLTEEYNTNELEQIFDLVNVDAAFYCDGRKQIADVPLLSSALMQQKNYYVDKLLEAGAATKIVKTGSYDGMSVLSTPLRLVIGKNPRIKDINSFKYFLYHPKVNFSHYELLLTAYYSALIDNPNIQRKVIKDLLLNGFSLNQPIDLSDIRNDSSESLGIENKTALDVFSDPAFVNFLPIFHKYRPEEVTNYIQTKGNDIAFGIIMEGEKETKEILPFLLRNGLNIRKSFTKNNDNKLSKTTLLHIAVMNENIEAINIIFNQCSDEDLKSILSQEDSLGHTPLDKAELIPHRGERAEQIKSLLNNKIFDLNLLNTTNIKISKPKEYRNNNRQLNTLKIAADSNKEITMEMFNELKDCVIGNVHRLDQHDDMLSDLYSQVNNVKEMTKALETNLTMLNEEVLDINNNLNLDRESKNQRKTIQNDEQLNDFYETTMKYLNYSFIGAMAIKGGAERQKNFIEGAIGSLTKSAKKAALGTLNPIVIIPVFIFSLGAEKSSSIYYNRKSNRLAEIAGDVNIMSQLCEKIARALTLELQDEIKNSIQPKTLTGRAKHLKNGLQLVLSS